MQDYGNPNTLMPDWVEQYTTVADRFRQPDCDAPAVGSTGYDTSVAGALKPAKSKRSTDTKN
jgi:hypothetical protein